MTFHHSFSIFVSSLSVGLLLLLPLASSTKIIGSAFADADDTSATTTTSTIAGNSNKFGFLRNKKVVVEGNRALNEHTSKCERIVDAVCGDGDNNDPFSTFCNLMEMCVLFPSEGFAYTVFAPTNDALGETVSSVTTGLDLEGLCHLLRFHIYGGKVLSYEELECNETLMMIDGSDSKTECGNGEKYQSGAGNNHADDGMMPKIVESDIEVCEGIVHVVDNAMLPTKLEDMSKMDNFKEPEHSRHNDHSSHDDQSSHDDHSSHDDTNKCDRIVDAVCGDGDIRNDPFGMFCHLMELCISFPFEGVAYTVFAPTNDALAESFLSGTTGLDQDELCDLLRFHVYGGKALSYEELECKETLTMIDGSESRTKCRNGEKYQSGRGNNLTDDGMMPKIMERDIEVCEGIVHVVNKAMLPMKLEDMCNRGSHDDHSSHDSDELLPTAINQIVLETETFIYCESETGCDDPQSYSTACGTYNVKSYGLVAGVLTSASGQFGVSYGNDGFFIDDGTGGIFVALNGYEYQNPGNLTVGTRVEVADSSATCLYGTKQLMNGSIKVIEDDNDDDKTYHAAVVPMNYYAPSQIGQFEKTPKIPNYDDDDNLRKNVCDCLDPVSYTQGRLITVKGTMIGGVFDDSPWGWKIFLDGEGGPAQIFIDGASDSYVKEEFIQTTLVPGNVLCVTGLVAQFAGVGWELLPRTEADVRLC